MSGLRMVLRLVHRHLSILAVVGALAISAGCSEESPDSEPPTPEGASSRDPAAATSSTAADSTPSPGTTEEYADYAGSRACRECHAEQFTPWVSSHHALAERPLDPELDRRAFDPPREIRHGSMTSRTRVENERYELITQGHGGERTFTPDRVFGVSPLRQFLIPGPGGRYQATELAYDPRSGDWFDVYGDEDRFPGEWGHWTGRGMSWNAMCAACHNTRLRKNYDAATDSYSTRMAEMGVGCEACHGPLKAHVEWQAARSDSQGDDLVDPTVTKLERPKILDNCGACHARRVELTGDFKPGDDFLDNFMLTIPDETEVYYPDGQVHDEDYEYGSFLGSVMYTKGVLCIDCHDPHSGKTKFQGNDLCLQCHKEKIDPGPHSHHEPGTPGGTCQDCHMPQTTYMQRHARRDHGFTIPDPRLTKEHAVPNACNRCHTDRSVEWAIEAVEEWYGTRPPHRWSQQRARLVARARHGDDDAVGPLLRMAREEPIPLWRAVATGLLGRWAQRAKVRESLIALTKDPGALVRGVAARALERFASGDAEVEKNLRVLLRDPLRAVRMEAAWALRRRVDPLSRAGEELRAFLDLHSDQPSGLYQSAVYDMDQGFYTAALEPLKKAVEWDARSAPIRQALAVCYSNLGQTARSVRELEAACNLAKDDPGYRYYLGLALGEIGKYAAARDALAKAVELDPQFARAWYNLGLTLDKLADFEGAIQALKTAEERDPESADFPYALSTILFKLDRLPEAHEAATRALQIAPEYGPARAIIDRIESGE